jgi:hypothetical protein
VLSGRGVRTRFNASQDFTLDRRRAAKRRKYSPRSTKSIGATYVDPNGFVPCGTPESFDLFALMKSAATIRFSFRNRKLVEMTYLHMSMRPAERERTAHQKPIPDDAENIKGAPLWRDYQHRVPFPVLRPFFRCYCLIGKILPNVKLRRRC